MSDQDKEVIFKRKPGRPRKTTPGPRYDRLAVYLEPELAAAIDAEVTRLKLRSKSEFLRQAAVEFLRRQEKRRARQDGEG